MTHPIDDAHLYEQKYFDGYYLKDAKRERMYEQEYARIKEYYPQGGKILDIGCGVGGFLNTFDDRWEKHGIEPSEFAFPRAVKKGINMLHSLRVAEFEYYDVVIFRGTLQHIALPMDALVQARRVLKKGGLLVILATPDTDSIVYKIWGNLPALDAPRNWVVFGGKVLTNILKRLEFRDIKLLHPYLDTPYASLMKDFFKFTISLVFGWRKFAFPGNQMEIYAIKE